MYEKLKKIRGIIWSSVLIAAFLAGCSGNAGAPEELKDTAKEDGIENNDKITIAVVPKLIGIPYFNSAQEGSEQAGRDLGVEVIYTGPTQADAAQQAIYIQDLIIKKVDAIAVSANDPEAIAPILKEAEKAGIEVLTWDADAREDARKLFVSPTSDEELGRHIMDTLAQQMGEEGEFAIITGSLTASNLNIWMKWMKQQAAEKYPLMKLVAVVPADDDQQKAFLKAQKLIVAYPNLRGIIGNSSEAVPGAAEAVKQAGMTDEIKVVGLSTPNLMKPYLNDNSAQVATLWSPKKLGYLTVAIAKQLVEGNTPVDRQEIPYVGRLSLHGDVIVMGSPTDFTKHNVDQYDF